MSRLIPLLIATAILLTIDIYAFQAIRTVTHHSSITVKRVTTISYWLISLITLSFIWYIVFFDYYALPKTLRVYLISALFVFYIPKILIVAFLLIDDVIRLVRWIASFFMRSSSTTSTSKTISRKLRHTRHGRFTARSGIRE